jgi:hypothetical protein
MKSIFLGNIFVIILKARSHLVVLGTLVLIKSPTNIILVIHSLKDLNFTYHENYMLSY